jgi:hypothetical protein
MVSLLSYSASNMNFDVKYKILKIRVLVFYSSSYIEGLI